MTRVLPTVLLAALAALVGCMSGGHDPSFEELQPALSRALTLIEREPAIYELGSNRDGRRRVNQRFATFDTARVDTSASVPTFAQKELLRRDSIDARTYRELAALLDSTAILDFHVTDDYVAFMTGGMLDNEEGYLFSKMKGDFKHEGATFRGVGPIQTSHIRGNWYRYYVDW